MHPVTITYLLQTKELYIYIYIHVRTCICMYEKCGNKI